MSQAPVAEGWSLRRVQQALGLSRHAVQVLIAERFVTPQRGPRNALRFSFRDLVLLRTAHDLRRARIPPRRIAEALARLREALPDDLPLTGLRISAEGADVVVRDGGAPWAPRSGQLVIDFVAAPDLPGALAVLGGEPKDRAAPQHLADAQALEATDRPAAVAAYRRAIDADPDGVPAYVALGAMLCEDGECAAAVRLFDAALARGLADALLHFNHAIALEDTGQAQAAAQRYRQALALDPRLADAHFNLARLLQQEGDAQGALRHWSAYRRLQREGG